MKAWVEKGAFYNKKGLKRFHALEEDRVQKILIIRHAALGDMIQLRPFLIELRALFPKAKLTLSLLSTYQIGAPTDLVDETHIVERKNSSPFYLWKSCKSLGAQDIIFDLAATSRSYLISRFVKAKLKLGFPYRWVPCLYDIRILRSDFQYEADLMLDFLAIFGHKAQYPLNFKLPEFQKSKAQKSVAFFLSSSKPDKNYPEDKFKTVIEKLSSDLPDYHFYIVQGRGGHEKFEKLFENLKHLNNVKLKEFSPLDDLTKWISEVSVLVSNDTGVRHIALGTHTPTVGLFNSTVPYRQWPRYEHVHECLFHRDGSYPSEVEVIESIKKLI